MLNSPTSSRQAKDWKCWFNERESSKFINRSAKANLFETFDAKKSPAECTQLLLQHEETVFLYKQNVGASRLNIFHHIISIGGTVYSPTKVFAAIERVSKYTLGIITPDMVALTQLLVTKENKVPNKDEFFKIASRSDALNIVSNGSNSAFCPRNFIPIPPFLLDTIDKTIEEDEGDPSHMLVNIINEIIDFDDLDFENNQEKAKSLCMDLLNWLFLVIKKKIYSIPTIGCSHRKMRDNFRSLEATTFGCPVASSPNLISPTVDFSQLKTPLELIATSQASTQEVLSKLTEMHTKTSEITTKSFRKFPPQYQHMMLIASSIGNVVPTEINEEAHKFFSSPDRVQSQLFLNSKLYSVNI